MNDDEIIRAHALNTPKHIRRLLKKMTTLDFAQCPNGAFYALDALVQICDAVGIKAPKDVLEAHMELDMFLNK